MECAVKRSGGVGKKVSENEAGVNDLSERQEIFRGMVEDKIRMQSRATENIMIKPFEEMKYLEGKKPEEALLFVQKKFDLWKCQNERDEARRLQRSGSSRRSQDVQVVMSEIAGKETRERGEDAWRLEPEGETETLETKVVLHGVEGVNVDPNGEGCDEKRASKNKSRRQSEAPGEECEEIQSPKRKIIRVESVETQDCVREANDVDQEEGEEVSFVSAFRKSHCFVVTISAARRLSLSGSWRRW